MYIIFYLFLNGDGLAALKNEIELGMHRISISDNAEEAVSEL